MNSVSDAGPWKEERCHFTDQNVEGVAGCMRNAHVPANSDVDRTDAIESQVERFAPGFRDRILARNAMRTADFARYNPNFIGGAITGGVADLYQLFTRPVARLNPYTTPNPRVLICSAATPPGGGVHGMGGYHAARTAFSRLERFAPAPLA